MNRHERRRIASDARRAGYEDAEVTVCAGPPQCLLEGDEAIANAKAGCPLCRRIVIGADGSEMEYAIKPN